MVLVIEAGVTWVSFCFKWCQNHRPGRNEGVKALIIPLLGPSLTPNTLYDWNFTTTAQKAYSNHAISYPRGRMLGGSSSVSEYSRPTFTYNTSTASYRLYGESTGQPEKIFIDLITGLYTRLFWQFRLLCQYHRWFRLGLGEYQNIYPQGPI